MDYYIRQALHLKCLLALSPPDLWFTSGSSISCERLLPIAQNYNLFRTVKGFFALLAQKRDSN